MATYNRYPAIDELNNLPPVVRQALAGSKEIKEAVNENVPLLVEQAIANDDTIAEAGVVAAKAAISSEIANKQLVSESNPRLPARESKAGFSFMMVDSAGRRTRLETNDVDGGPTEHSLSLDGPALKNYMDFVDGEDARLPVHTNLSGTSLAFTDASGRPLWIQANDTDGGPTKHTLDVLVSALGVATTKIDFIADGDSITQGGHGGGTPHNWPAHLSTLLGKPVINRGRSGSTGVEAAMQQGGLTPILTIPGGVLPKETTVQVPVELIFPTPADGAFTGSTGHGRRLYAGTFDGIPAELAENMDDTWTIRRTVAGTSEYKTTPRTPFIIDGLNPKATRIFWPGRNDYPKTNVLANIDRMAKWTTDNGGRFLVLSILTRTSMGETSDDNKEIRAVNEEIQLKYPRNYVNIRDWLVYYGIEAVGLTPTAEDDAAKAKGAIPPSLMADGLHPNADGRIAIAKYIHQQLVARNWQ